MQVVLFKYLTKVFYSIAPKPTTNKKPYRFSRVGEGRSKDAQTNHLAERLVSNYLVMRTLSELENSDTSGDE